MCLCISAVLFLMVLSWCRKKTSLAENGERLRNLNCSDIFHVSVRSALPACSLDLICGGEIKHKLQW